MAYSKEQILKLLYSQLDNFFFISDEERDVISSVVDDVLERCRINFYSSDNKYFIANRGGFYPFHSVMNMIFLYYMSNELYKRGKSTELCDKVYYLNKIMNSVDLFYAIELPEKFGAEHPLSSVMGRAKYANGFFFYQGCTVGGNRDKEGTLHYPVIGENVKMFANSSIIGKCTIGNNVTLGAGTLVKNIDIPDNTLVFGQSPNLILKQK